MKIHITNCNKKAPYQYVNLIANAFKALGHEVFKFDDADYSSFNLTIDRLIRRSPLFLLTKKRPDYFDFKERHKNLIGKKWLETLKDFKPDMILIINTGWLSKNAVRIAKENLHIPKIVCWIVDDPRQSAAEDLVNFLPYCDIVFIVDPGWIPFAGFFNKNIFYLPLGSSDICYKPLNQPRDLDFSFVGSFFVKDPAGFLRAFILSGIPTKYKVEIYGPGINFFKNVYPQLKNFNCYDRHLNESEVNKLWNRSKLTPVIYHPQVLQGTSPRVFDTALTKTPQVIQYTSTIQELFPGIEIPVFKSVLEFSEKIEYYLTYFKEREKLAEAMFKIVKERHLFIHRIKRMMELLNLK
jgi:hypothetical protein